MTPTQFQAWAASCGLRSDQKIADALGIWRLTARKYRLEGTDNKCVRLAMAAVSKKLEPYE